LWKFSLNELLSPIFYLVLALTAILSLLQIRVFPSSSARGSILLIASLAAGAIFYPYWMAVLLLVAVVIVFPIAMLLAKGKGNVIWLFVFAMVAALAAVRSESFARYWNQWASTLKGAPTLTMLVGTSYFFLRMLSLWFDARNGKTGEVTLSGTLNYLLFFPTFVSGPIDRYARFTAQIAQPQPVDATAVDTALWRGVVGLFKKVVLADTFVHVCFPTGADAASHIQSATTHETWIAFYAYAARIYLDFSGYTDVAIAAGLLLGIKVPENFRWPYGARNITEFWRRWHISLSEWLRDYIFLPSGLSLSRGVLKGRSLAAGCAAALFTFGLCGLWHGMSANFLIWGLMHGTWVFGHKLYNDLGRKNLPQGWWQWSRESFLGDALAILLTFHGVAITWIWFSTPDNATALLMFKKLLGIH
jgi:alginate O-acetyltransferase complex protein AlgI